MPRKYARIDGKPRERFPNAKPGWDECPMTCPESCPFEECTMPLEMAARLEPPHWHGWIIDKNGFTVKDSPIRKWAKEYLEGLKHGKDEPEQRESRRMGVGAILHGQGL